MGWRRVGAAAFLALWGVFVGCGGGGGGDGGGGKTWTNAGVVWTAPYSSGGAEPSTVEYRRSGTTVELRGIANAGATGVRSGQIIGTLPEGCRPPGGISAKLLAPTYGWPAGLPEDGYIGTAGVVVHHTGEIEVKTVQQYEGEQTFLFLDGLSFSTVWGSDGWTDNGFSWTAPYSSGGTYPSMFQFRKTGTTVQLSGFADAGGTHVRSGQFIGTLPEGFRPPYGSTPMLLCPTWGWPTGHGENGYIGTAGVIVYFDGRMEIKTVQQFDTQQQYLDLYGLSFSTVTGSDGWTDNGFSWNAPYTDVGGYHSNLEFRKDGDVVWLQGFANAGSTHVRTGQVVGAFPEGFRPPPQAGRFLLCPTWGWPSGYPGGYIGTAGVAVMDDGYMFIHTVQQFDAAQQFVWMDGKNFSTEP